MDVLFDLATPADDPAIRRLLATNPIPGAITLTYEREPNYFLGCGIMGRFSQIIVARHQPSGEVVGLACRATRPLFINGHVEEVGYLGQLRVAPHFQGRWIVSQGFRYLWQLHADGRVDGYITTIIADNPVAEGVLVSRAPRHFPAYRAVERVFTLALIVSRFISRWSARERKMRHSLHPMPCYELHRGARDMLPAIVAFLQAQGAAKQFYPVYTEEDFQPDSPTTRGFCLEDFIIASHCGEIVGVIGLWDQSRYKQTIIQAYQGNMRWLKPFYNASARLIGAQPLPPPGNDLRYAYASFICIAQNDPQIFRVLLQQVFALATERGYTYLMVGLSASDPLLSIARRYAHIPYESRLYTVCWRESDRTSLHERLDGRIPYIEIATL